MRIIPGLICFLFFWQAGMAQPACRKEVYSWLSLELVPRDTNGNVNGTPHWNAPIRMPFPGDTFAVSKNRDSIRMIANKYNHAGNLFIKTRISASGWKAAPSYADIFFLLGTYKRAGLSGLYFSFYITKDWSSLMQIEYTNPGNIHAAAIFSKGFINILEKRNIIINPKKEQPEPKLRRS